MRLLGKTAIIVGMAGAMALGSMTASQARWRGTGPAVAGFVAGAAIGAAAANANAGYYYGSGYGYNDYAYAPGYTYDGPASAYTGDPAYNYGGYGYSGYSNYGYNNNLRERQLEGRDY
jgi:hypothetical protein